MADAERCDYHEDILPKKDSVLDMIRVATYIHQIPTALDMVKDAHDKGYETTVNLMAASTIPDRELNEGLEMLAKSEAKAIYVVDSFGAFYSEQVRALVKKYLRLLQGVAARKWACTCTTTCNSPSPTPSKASSKAPISSTPPWPAWAAARAIARWNCCSRSCTTRNTNCAPCSTACRTTSSRCARNCLWGYDLPYLLTGMLNQHPRTAIKFKEAELKGEKGDILKFHDTVTDQE